MAGTLIAQSIPILLQPVLKRLFSPEDFGAFDIYFRTVSLLAILFTLRYEKAIVLCRQKRDAFSVYAGIAGISFGLMILLEILLLMFKGRLAGLLSLPGRYSIIVYLIPVSSFFLALTSGAQFYLIREKRFFGSSSLKIFRRSLEGIIQSVGGLLKSFWGLPLGDMVGNATSAVIGAMKVSGDIPKTGIKSTFTRFWANARKYSDLPKYALLSNLMNTFVLSALTFQVYAKFSLSDVGHLELTQKILTVPSALAGIAIGQLVLQRVSSAFNERRSVVKEIAGLSLVSILISLGFFATIYFWAPPLFRIVFGIDWEISGEYAQILIISTCLFFVISPLGQALVALQKIKENALWEIGKFFAIGSLFLFQFRSIEQYLKIYNIIVLAVYLVYAFMIITITRSYELKIKFENKN